MKVAISWRWLACIAVFSLLISCTNNQAIALGMPSVTGLSPGERLDVVRTFRPQFVKENRSFPSMSIMDNLIVFYEHGKTVTDGFILANGMKLSDAHKKELDEMFDLFYSGTSTNGTKFTINVQYSKEGEAVLSKTYSVCMTSGATPRLPPFERFHLLFIGVPSVETRREPQVSIQGFSLRGNTFQAKGCFGTLDNDDKPVCLLPNVELECIDAKYQTFTPPGWKLGSQTNVWTQVSKAKISKLLLDGEPVELESPQVDDGILRTKAFGDVLVYLPFNGSFPDKDSPGTCILVLSVEQAERLKKDRD